MDHFGTDLKKKKKQKTNTNKSIKQQFSPNSRNFSIGNDVLYKP